MTDPRLDALITKWREQAKKYSGYTYAVALTECADELSVTLASLTERPEPDGLPGDDEITTIRWGRLRELFDAEAEIMLRRASLPEPAQTKDETTTTTI